ncbi:MAG: hypothetical protein IJ343_11800 [Clostridia bacterium]|nr:hypothetical protein [Clostridia bacterium]
MAAKYDQWLTEEGLLRIQGWARDGLTDKDIAENMAVGLSTLREWKNRFEQIKGALSIGKDAADRVVENALYKSACGYTETIWKPMRIKTIEYDPETGKKVREVEKVVAVEEQIHFPAQVTAQIFWLKNRKLKEWRNMDTREQEARIKVLESKAGSSAEEKEDDGFLDALKESAREDWGGSDAAGGV